MIHLYFKLPGLFAGKKLTLDKTTLWICSSPAILDHSQEIKVSPSSQEQNLIGQLWHSLILSFQHNKTWILLSCLSCFKNSNGRFCSIRLNPMWEITSLTPLTSQDASKRYDRKTNGTAKPFHSVFFVQCILGKACILMVRVQLLEQSTSPDGGLQWRLQVFPGFPELFWDPPPAGPFCPLVT